MPNKNKIQQPGVPDGITGQAVGACRDQASKQSQASCGELRGQCLGLILKNGDGAVMWLQMMEKSLRNLLEAFDGASIISSSGFTVRTGLDLPGSLNIQEKDDLDDYPHPKTADWEIALAKTSDASLADILRAVEMKAIKHDIPGVMRIACAILCIKVTLDVVPVCVVALVSKSNGILWHGIVERNRAQAA
jgi:hypothetical protein